MTRKEWINKCNHWKKKWPTITDKHKVETGNGINLYAVIDAVNKSSESDHILVGDAGSISYIGPVALEAKENQRMIFSPAQADMGWALPGAIGVALASGKPVIAITGDGSFMSNSQELAVIKYHQLNIKVIILNNSGYLSIRNTQKNYYNGRVYGTGTSDGLWFPNFVELGEAYKINGVKFSKVKELEKMKEIVNETNPFIVDCVCMNTQPIEPSQAMKDGRQAGPHDMAPFLNKEEIESELLVDIPIT